jgi:hypothetical protein
MLGREYHSEMVLMVAERYAVTRDLDFAIQTLTNFFSQSPLNAISDSLQYAGYVGYPPQDIRLLQDLFTAVQVEFPGVSP